MNVDAKAMHIRWRRILFFFHLSMGLVARLFVGSLDKMPPPDIYNGFALWGLFVAGHALLLAVLDGRDRAELPFDWMKSIVQPRERRLMLLVVDAALWMVVTMAIANRVIPEGFIFQNVVMFSLLWLAHTAIGFLHLLLVIYAEVYDRTAEHKEKYKNKFDSELPVRLAVADDGELVDFAQVQSERKRVEDA